MPCSGQSLTAPNISCLDFNLAWDLSGATPIVTITNNSTVSNYAKLKWWFYVVSPSGVAIYGVDLDTASSLPTPDVTGVSWATKVITLPTPFGNPPCGQVEFSQNSPYAVFVYVQDIDVSTTTYFTYEKDTIIVRPKGNTNNSCGNFGTAAVSMKVDCASKVIMLFDSTKLTYNNIITPLTTSNLWTIVYPQDPTEDIPTRTATSVPNVNFPISVNSEGYVLYFNEYATYDYGNGITVKVQFKLFDKNGGLGQNFAINCDTNLCLLQCQMRKFYELSKSSCGTLENAELTNKMVRMNWIFSEVLTGIFQPLCGIDVPKLIKEIQRIGNFDPNCDCNCGSSDNFGFSNPTGTGASSGACCPSYSSVLDINTGIAPAQCPNGYFPAQVYNVGGTAVIGVALTATDLINIINANAGWHAYGTAFNAGNCTVGWFPLNSGTVIPSVNVSPIGGGTGSGTIIVNVLDVTSSIAPAPCPGSYFPAQVYNPAATTIIGVAYDVSQMVGILNANGAWAALGTAFVVDNCHVGFFPALGVTSIPPVKVDSPTKAPCVNGTQIYPVTLSDVCVSPPTTITPSSFPLNAYVDFGLGAGPQFVGNVGSQAALIAALNSFSGKPSVITFSAGPTVDQVIVTNSDCTIYSGTIAITADVASNSYLLYGGNHTDLLGTFAFEDETAFSLQYLSILGKIGGIDGHTWHTIKIGNVLLGTDPQQGKVYFWDITNPLMPTLSRTISLNAVVAECFTGVPASVTIASATQSPVNTAPTQYDLYFPTDYYAAMTLREIYVVESLTGCIWKIDYYLPGSGILASFQDDKLIGKCPRILINGLLYFTQDGNLEAATGQISGVPDGRIIVLDLSDFTASGLSERIIFLNQTEAVWAASYDGAGTIYFTGQKTSIATFNAVTDTIGTRYLYVGGTGLLMAYRANTTYYSGKLYVQPQNLPGYNGMIITLSTLGGTVTIAQYAVPSTGAIDGLFNFMPLDNCLGILTTALVPGTAAQRMLVYRIDGVYLTEWSLPSGQEFYNVVFISGITSVTPNTFFP